MRYKVTISYDGSNYQGYQVQNDTRTIQNEIQMVLTNICKEPITIHASGRTDAGVHAENQVFHFDANNNMKPENWKKALNGLLPGDIFVKSVEEVDDDFHARYDVASKEYIYLLSIKAYNPMQTKYICQYGKNLDVDVMNKAAKLFVGTHDFRSFCSNKDSENPNFIRTIFQFDVTIANGIIEFKVVGSGFLRYMVRMMVGTLVEIGRGNKDKNEIIERLDQTQRNIVPYNAPACGLYLNHVTYKYFLHNYHTHTKRCRHAVGEDEEYVLAAIRNDFKTLGFSDHYMSTLVKEDWKMRGESYELSDYLDSIKHLKEKYQSQIRLYLGMECEYFPNYEAELRELIASQKCDYLVLGLHYIHMTKTGFIDTYSGDLKTSAQIEIYGELACQALQTGLFSIFAHPDIFMTSYPTWDETCENVARQICYCALENDVPLEINLRGMYFFPKSQRGNQYRYPYPYPRFFEIAKEMGNKIIIGMDAHDPNELTQEKYALGLAFAQEIGLSVVKKTSFKKV